MPSWGLQSWGGFLHKATQTRLLVSRPHPDENGCGREVNIHYSLFPVLKIH